MATKRKREPSWFDGFRARLERVKDERFDGVAAAFSKRAGLSSTHVGQILRGQTGKRVSAETIEKLARAGDVDVDWLTHGFGDMGTFGRRTVEADDRYASRPAAATAARLIAVPDDAIQRVLTWDLESDEDPGAAWWLDQMRAEGDRLKRTQRAPQRESAARAADFEQALETGAAARPELPGRKGRK